MILPRLRPRQAKLSNGAFEPHSGVDCPPSRPVTATTPTKPTVKLGADRQNSGSMVAYA
jgi:hypothetical protein